MTPKEFVTATLFLRLVVLGSRAFGCDVCSGKMWSGELSPVSQLPLAGNLRLPYLIGQ